MQELGFCAIAGCSILVANFHSSFPHMREYRSVASQSGIPYPSHLMWIPSLLFPPGLCSSLPGFLIPKSGIPFRPCKQSFSRCISNIFFVPGCVWPAESLLDKAPLPSRGSQSRGETGVDTGSCNAVCVEWATERMYHAPGAGRMRQQPGLWSRGKDVRKSFSQVVMIITDMFPC